MWSYLWRQQECYSDNLIKLPMSAGIWLQNGSFYKHHYFYNWQKYARSGANSFTNTYFTTCVVNCLQVQSSKMLKVLRSIHKKWHSSYKDLMDFALLPVSHPRNFTSFRGVTPTIYINLHLNQAISCIQYWTWDYVCV